MYLGAVAGSYGQIKIFATTSLEIVVIYVFIYLWFGLLGLSGMVKTSFPALIIGTNIFSLK